MTKKVYVVVTTKNRINFLRKAIKSVENQTFKPSEIILVSDSNSNYKDMEKKYITGLKVKVTYISNRKSKCYGGSLNTAIEYLLLNNRIEELIDSYVAILDDDDTWNYSYLENCIENLDKEYEFLVPGIKLFRNNQTIKLSIPQNLDHKSFLSKNPHIQGSNTFIKFRTILEAGCFDENIHSTTDREFFTRVMLLNPRYKNLNKHYVNFNCENNRNRISNNKEKKIDGLANFYYKNNMFFDKARKKEFLENIKKFDINVAEINEKLEKKKINEPIFNETFDNKESDIKVTIGIVATYELVKNLIEDIDSFAKNKNVEVVVIDNFKNTMISNEFNEYLKKIPYIKFVKKSELKKNSNSLIYGDEVKCNMNVNRDYIRDIAISRTILFHHMYNIESDVYWVLDDDMRLEYLDLGEKGYEKIPFNLFSYLETVDYKKTDALVGKYTNDSPLPMLYTLRSQLVDYLYNNVDKKNEIKFLNKDVLFSTDFYHDLSKYNIFYETPVYNEGKKSLEKIFSGIQEYRKLHRKIPSINSNTSCGGNILIFNKELLKVENQSIIINGLYGRRGDSLWRIFAREAYGFKIENGDFSTLHSRGVVKFDLLNEIEKVKKDIIGHAFINAFTDYISKEKDKGEIVEIYFEYLQSRVNDFVKQYYRIIGLMKSINNYVHKVEELKQFENFNINNFISYFNAIEKSEVEYEMKEVINKFKEIKNSINEDIYKSFIGDKFFVKQNKLRLLGKGNEGIVFTDDKKVYKVFYQKEKLLKLKENNLRNKLKDSKHFYCVEIFNEGFDVIVYKYEESEHYKGGKPSEMISLLKEMYEKKFIYGNLKKNNFVIVGDLLKVIDYGESFFEYSEDSFEKTMKKAYLLVKYPNLPEREYKKITQKIIRGKEHALLYGFDEFKLAIINRHHVIIHDIPIIKYVKEKKWSNLLDYGAGKCQNSNKLSLMFSDRNIYAFDILYEQVKERAKNINIIESIESVSKEKFDYILCNLVLSILDFDSCDMILANINRVSKPGANVLISISNPFFTNSKSTEIKLSTEEVDLYRNQKLTKKVKSTSRYRDDYYKTINTYKHLFRRNGFKISNTFESNGVDFEKNLPSSDFLYIELEKISDILLLEDVSLLIKANLMEYKTIRKQVENLVTSIEVGCKFKEKVLLVDDFDNIPNRQYSEKNGSVFFDEIDNLLNNDYLDRVIIPKGDPSQIKEIYKKYFDIECLKPHSQNGQQLFTTLYGFENILTNKVLQVDSDIIVRAEKREWVEKAIKKLEEENVLTISLNIPNSLEKKEFYGKEHRVEVRGSLIDLNKLNKNLPLENSVENEVMNLSWHRSLDFLIKKSELKSLRSADNNFYFIHPENKIKKNNNFYNKIIDYNEKFNRLPSLQFDKVNIIDDKSKWEIKSNDDVIVFSRGKNTNMGKLKRFFDSLEKQTFKDYRLIYIDDYSDNFTEEYAKFRCEFFKLSKKPIYIRNYKNKKMVKNLFLSMGIIENDNAIIIHVDNDDSLICANAIELILEKYKKGHDVTLGNCLRVDKPMKNYFYGNSNAKLIDYTNYWIHPKSHRRYLFDGLSLEDFKFEGKVYEVNSDIIMMKNIIKKSKNPTFIKEHLYLFDPSQENLEEKNEYERGLKERIKKLLVEREENK